MGHHNRSLPVKPIFPAVLMACLAGPVLGQGIDFGDDSGEYSNDGECDDRRFFGSGMAETLDWEDTGRDATDCRAAFQAERISLWVFADALAATQCDAIDFGDNTSEYANDGECDDPRFEGMAIDGVLIDDDRGHDANDCRRACEFGLLGLRDYSAGSRSKSSSGKAQPAITSD